VNERRLAIGPAPLDVATVVRAVTRDDAGTATADQGAVVTFVGTVKASSQGRTVLRLEYEAFEELALRTFALIADEVAGRWPSARMALHHRTGPVALGEASVVIAAASPHRADAFAVCRYVIERVKQVAPVWKREFFEGGDVWLEGATADPSNAAAREEAYRRACG
jgi:molybdopterin synthase catalytic subunit